MFENKKFVLMDAGMFCAGMRVKSPIYYFYKDAYILLCKDVVFTSELIEKLYEIAQLNHGVYIEEQNYEEVWNESLMRYSMDSRAYQKAFQQVRQDYENILSKTVSFLGDISPRSGVSLVTAQNITDIISEELDILDQNLVLRCINMICDADSYLYTHCVNVAALNGLMGRWLMLSDTEIKQLIKIGLVHDIGKLMISPRILNKPGKLTSEEFEAVKRHPIYSYDMLLKSGEGNPKVLSAVKQHHEKPNGIGYPDGLTLDQISLFARITSVSDVYDAMVSKRSYKEAISPFQVLAQFKENSFFSLDKRLVDIFLQNITYLFVGMHVLLSNGDWGEVVFVPPNDFAYPVVKVGNRVMATNSEYKCIAVESYFS